MTGGSRIVAFGPGGDPSRPEVETTTDGQAMAAPAPDPDEWYADEVYEEPARREWVAPALALGAIAGWTGFFLWALRYRFIARVTPEQGAVLIGNWAVPVLLVCAIWLIAMRSSRREGRRFADVAAVLSAESRRLEERLTVVNRELSLAREFIAGQSRDLESLGRVAAERISEHAGRLQELVADNAAQVESIAGVSTTALDNMERLRSQLPVVASSARDVANNIGHAGRTAQGELEQLSAAFSRLAATGAACAGKVDDVRSGVDQTLEQFQLRLDQLQAVIGARMEELEQRGEDLRTRLAASESAALAALRERAAALVGEVDSARERLDGSEAEALTALGSRLAALREEAGALGRNLRDEESTAMQAFHAARERMEADLRAMLERLDQLDRDALEAARSRIATLSQEAGEFDDRLAERNRQFIEETNQRLADTAARHDAETARLAEMFARLDAELESRRDAQARHQAELSRTGEAIAERLESLSDRIAAISAFGNQAEDRLGNGLRLLAERLAAGREALAGTDTAVEQLTDGAVRLLELLQASTEQSRDHLPVALDKGETRLAEIERRVASLYETVEAAATRTSEIAATIAASHAGLPDALAEIGRLQAALGDGAREHEATLANLQENVTALQAETLALASEAQERLSVALDQLGAATRSAVTTLVDDSNGAVTTLAERLGDKSAQAIERILQVRMAEAVGQLEQAAGHAAGVSREAAIQLRDQLARVDELTGNLERRVAQVRARAEEQVDNDFSRRVALITESLNSNAIDIAKALSTEVTDTAWAAYLRGDRGVFTRRAVKLLDASEAREVARIYDEDSEFRDHVSRYIHDFEAMLRQLLSTRDGHALGVTLLSSDMGKLYVVLAQAIERLRT